jgi:5-methylthioadenosine/S-adenosylhomocysteine deaminase
VSHVWVDGKILVKEGKLTTLNEQEILAKSLFWEDRIKINKNG